MNVACPVCDSLVTLPADTQVTELITCDDCQTRLVVDAIGENPRLNTAPEVEEDWGE